MGKWNVPFIAGRFYLFQGEAMTVGPVPWLPLLTLALITSCGESGSLYSTGPNTGGTGGDYPANPVSDATITVENNDFNPALVTLSQGGTVTWNWTGSGHNVTSVGSPSFTASTDTQSAGFTFGPVIFNTVGTYRFICSIHGAWDGTNTSGMAGSIKVQATSGSNMTSTVWPTGA
jgi:plastocyanin